MSVVLSAGAGGLPRLTLRHPAGSTAEVYLHGAHLSSWIPAGQTEALFVSRSAVFRPGAAIRGGVPVVFPQFGDLGPLPKHGFARTRPWRWLEEAGGPDAAPRAVLRLEDSEETRALWPHAFRAELAVELGERGLGIALSVLNTGRDALRFTAALHTYLRVAEVARVVLGGLRGTPYRDRTAEGTRREEAPELVLAGEIDRVYLGAPPEVRVRDGAGGRAFVLGSRGFPDLVVWNPWRRGAGALPDMEEGEFREMLCVEAARVADPVDLAPGAAWRGEQRLRLEPDRA